MNGIYEQIINQLFRQKLKDCNTTIYYIGKKAIGREEAITYLSRYLYTLLQRLICDLTAEENGVEKSIQIVNAIIKKLGREFNIDNYEDDLIDVSHSILLSIIDKTACDYPDIEQYIQQITPFTSLTKSSLFTGSNQSVELYSELKREILSSDETCLLVSFIRLSGLNLLYPALKKLTEQGKRLRVITTTYMEVTDYSAICKLAALPNTEIKISYNQDNDRLHAKAYLFLRNTGFHTAYIGSSNISAPALTKGTEWNVKVTQVELPQILATVRNTFNTYWEDPAVETFVLGRDNERLKQALNSSDKLYKGIDYSVLDLIRAKEYQKDILDRLDIERHYHDRWKNLIVAATGTGKTVIAAFDYKRFKEEREKKHQRANLLFVVHREEIIKQACATFRNVLEDQNFGDMWYGGHETTNYSCVFASKDLLNNRIDQLQLPEDYYDYIIFDEAHHIVAETYQKIYARFKPKVLVGLTATPERMDGQDITPYFDNVISAEIRLDTALNNNLLAPFHYYGITDNVDLENIRWNRGGFVAAELSKVYTENDMRTSLIFKALEKYLQNYRDVRALCFCVDQAHAESMAAKFTLAGLKAAVMTSEHANQRNIEISRLAEKKINYLFVVDMFNEGVDIPTIDTILFLRPTESLTIFLQQFGRGLRKAEGKSFLTVLDFVGHTRSEFNYMDRFRTLMGRTSMGVAEEIERDFPHLPLGCHIQLEEKAKDYILENIRAYTNNFKTNRIIQNIRNFKTTYDVPLSLKSFVKMTHVPLERIYSKSTWNELCVQAEVSTDKSDFNKELLFAVKKKWLSTDSYSYFSFIHELAKRSFRVEVKAMNKVDQQRALMLYYDFYDKGGEFETLQDMFDLFSLDPVFVNEVREVTSILRNQCTALEKDDNSTFFNFPLKLHGEYTRAQIQVAINRSSLAKKSSGREGVERSEIQGRRLEAMFVDIIKDREEGSNTNYNDFAQSDTLFHWESQNAVSQNTSAGKNYIHQTQTMLLFVRKQNTVVEDKTRTMGYIYLGQVHLVSYEGNKPMQIVWKLKTPMPGSVYEYAAKYKMIG